jgi:hypothetical protein
MSHLADDDSARCKVLPVINRRSRPNEFTRGLTDALLCMNCLLAEICEHLMIAP